MLYSLYPNTEEAQTKKLPQDLQTTSTGLTVCRPVTFYASAAISTNNSRPQRTSSESFQPQRLQDPIRCYQLVVSHIASFCKIEHHMGRLSVLASGVRSLHENPRNLF